MRCVAVALVSAAMAVAVPSASAGRLDLSRYALTARDVPAGLHASKSPHVSAAQAARELTLDAFHFMNKGGYDLLLMGFRDSGYLDGYQVSFSEGPRSGAWKGQTVVASHVTAYRDAQGARAIWKLAAIDYLTNDFKCRRLTGAAAIGPEGHFCSKFETVSGRKVVTYEISWRQAALRGSIALAGQTSAVSPAQALGLARVQEARMKTA